MIKELKKDRFPKLDSLIKKFTNRIATDWPKIIGQGASIIFKNYYSQLFQDIKRQIDNKIDLLEYKVSGEHEGGFFVMFNRRDAVIISGSILMEEEDEIKKSIVAYDLNQDYLDAFREFGNQTSSSFEVVYRNSFPNNEDNHIRFKQSHHLPVAPDQITKKLPLENDDELFIVNKQCSIWNFDKGEINLLFQIELVESFYNEQVIVSKVKTFANIIVITNCQLEIYFIKKALRHSGYNVFAYKDWKLAVLKLEYEKFIDLVIIDSNIGEYDGVGLDLCAKIKRNILLEHIPIIMMAGNPTKNKVLESLRAGAIDFIVKPLSNDRLLNKLAKHVRKNNKLW